jgi:hypothetical protein
MRHRLAGAFSASLVLIVALLVAIVVTVLTWLIPVARAARRVTGYLARAPLGVRLALTLVLYMLSERLLRSHGAYSIAALVLVNNGEGLLLNNFLNKSAPQDWRMFLFKNNITPAETDTIATYTKSTFTGSAHARRRSGSRCTILPFRALACGSSGRACWRSSPLSAAGKRFP